MIEQVNNQTAPLIIGPTPEGILYGYGDHTAFTTFKKGDYKLQNNSAHLVFINPLERHTIKDILNQALMK